MLPRSALITQDQVISSSEAAPGQPKRPLLVTVTIFAIFVSLLLIFGVMLAARTQPILPMPNLPQLYLPGNSIPNRTSCYWPGDEHLPRCAIQFEEDDVYFSNDLATNMITRTFIPARDYKIGEIVSAWGMPTGITRRHSMISVHWGARSVLLYTRSFQPDSIVEYIQYDLEPLSASPWRGFGLFE